MATERGTSCSLDPEVAVALYRFLFAPVLLAVAVLTTSPRRAQPPPAVHVEEKATVGPAAATPSRGAGRELRVGPSHPGSVR